ncbi:low affinity immunoglobulin epsilon Fc receptor-like [Littorina saxatilis]|uniref:C-type lectin domain-containing protein n=1 Tax=Littorina saxatilis TaxID=31220 RepID=A0AAN9AMM3_9CAEN
MASARLVVFIVSATAALAAEAPQRCPNEWVYFQNSCYAFMDVGVSWGTAETYCHILNPESKMLEVETKAENDFIAAQINARDGIREVWQGVNDLLREGHWVFNSNGQEAASINWHAGHPKTHIGNGEDCVMIDASGSWNDMLCEYQSVYAFLPSPVCELDAPDDSLIG